jgi:hypothetical protein
VQRQPVRLDSPAEEFTQPDAKSVQQEGHGCGQTVHIGLPACVPIEPYICVDNICKCNYHLWVKLPDAG